MKELIKMDDQVIANDMFIATKTIIKNYAAAITETTSVEVRDILRRQLEEAITSYEIFNDYMSDRGYTSNYDLSFVNLDLDYEENISNYE